ncbi:interferon-induced, double-stranded RNA-activated protein kinase [Phalacrocorax carbo]|uniref:interferon-induced, double-stranded RNA-activated protein kinase n=1 Tax=Phalacrocorax carbo TaxID=9209 RepID=UPI00311A0B6C
MAREYMEKINNYCQKQKFTLVYSDLKMTGPSHDPEFTVVVKINDREYGTGTGKNKKEARAVAAKKTWEMIEKQPETPSNTQAAELLTTQATLFHVLSGDYVSMLNRYSQKTLQTVDYTTGKRTGDAHAPIFTCSCTISGSVYGIGRGTSLAAAKQDAAKNAFEKLKAQGDLTVGSEKSQSDSDSSCFEDSGSKFVVKMKDMEIREKPSPSQGDAQSSAPKSRRKLAANFDNVRKEEEKKKMADSHDESLTDLGTDTSELNGSTLTVNDRFLQCFKNIEPIGEGGFGNVFKATAKLDKKTYAVKRVEFTKDVEREVEELARLDHENIVRYYCSWKGRDNITDSEPRPMMVKNILCLFIQMELCEQGPLGNWIEKNRRDRKYHEMAQNKFLQILKGVKYIHSKELIHRDLKPQNIFISHEDKIKIGDFGLVTSVACGALTENRGTATYMAPEQFGGKYGKEVDIYALGLIWFEILSAFSSQHERSKVWTHVRECNLPESFTKRFPAEAPIIKKMLSGEPSGRYSASEILTFLESNRANSFKIHTR